MTTRLGYGCSSVMGGMGRRESLRMLEAAFDAGVRHFDVAPMYGFGEAEACVGDFLARHKGEVTVTTKYGIAPERSSGVKSALRAVARPLVKAMPSVKRMLARPAAASRGTGAARRPPLNAQDARRSLDESLRKLRTERIDVWLLHEATVESVADDALLRLLEDAVARGEVGTFGVGSSRAETETLLRERPEYCPVQQFEWSVLDAPVPAWPGFRMHHRALTENFGQVRQALGQSGDTCRAWSDSVGADLSDAALLAKLMLKAALVMNPAAVVLFSTKKTEHVRGNVETADDARLETPARALHALIQESGLPRPDAEAAAR